MKCSVTVSLVEEARGGPFIYWDDLPAAFRQAAELGFDGIEIFAPGPEAIEPVQLKNLLKEYRLGLAAMGTGGGWVKHKLTITHPDSSIRAKGIAFVKSIVQLAGSFGAPAIIGSMQGRWGEGRTRDETLSVLRDSLNELGDFAGICGAPLLYETLNRYETNLLTLLDDGVNFLKTLQSRHVLLLADLFHMNIEEADIATSLRRAGKSVGHIHFVDSNRKAAGMGHMDYAPIANALRESGYGSYLSAEAFPHPDSHAAARQTKATFDRYFR